MPEICIGKGHTAQNEDDAKTLEMVQGQISGHMEFYEVTN